jgi:branched-subunit amino acid aminotransferase/4-amino-4-deoxychorismate lyase
MDVYLNGRMVKHDKARVAADDAGFQHAVGLFETLSAHHGRCFRLPQHLERLENSARELGLTKSLDLAKLTKAVETTLAHNKLDRARVRLTITAGAVSLLRESAQPPAMTVHVAATPPIEYDPAYFERGITVLIAPPAANPFDPLSGHKTLSYWARLRTLRQAAAVGAGETIWLNITNHLASGAISNVFLVKDGSLFTPFARGEEVDGALPAPVLPGITRALVLECAQRLHIPTQRRMLSVNDLLEADECFLTNSSWQVLPVTRVEKKAIGSSQVGEMTLRLRTAVLDAIAQECGSHDQADAHP